MKDIGQSHCADHHVYSQDAMRSVTKQAIREARLKEVKEELLRSEKLKVRGGVGLEGLLLETSLLVSSWEQGTASSLL